MATLTSLKNIGKEIERKLKSVGITTAEELKKVGSKKAFVKLKSHYSNLCLVHLYSLEGAVSGVEYNKLPEDVKQDLKELLSEELGIPKSDIEITKGKTSRNKTILLRDVSIPFF